MRKMFRSGIVLVTFLLLISGAAVSYAQTTEQNTAARYLNTGIFIIIVIVTFLVLFCLDFLLKINVLKNQFKFRFILLHFFLV